MPQLTLPNRPLIIAKAGRPAYWGLIILSLCLIAFGCGLAYWQLPGLQHDWTISRNPVVVYDGDVQDGKCTTRKAIFTDCSAHLSYNVDGTHYETDADLMFVDFHMGDYTVDIVRSGDQPALATMSIGIDKLWNRIILFLVFMGFTVVTGIILFAKALGLKRSAAMMATPGKITVHEVVVNTVTNNRKTDAITFQNPQGPKPKASFVTSFRKADAPLAWTAADGTTRALAVQHQAATLPVILDAGLTRLNLTDAERETALAGLRGV